MKKQLIRLFEYNLWANQKFAEVLVSNEFKHPKILRFISHTANAQLIWFDRVNGKVSQTPVWIEYPISEAIDLLINNSKAWLRLLNEKEDFTSAITYVDSGGASHQSVLSDIITHVANHGTHHRGQIALLLREEGIAPPASDFMYFSRA